MAATAGDIIKKSRYELHDMQGSEYGDEELLHYLADAVSMLSRLLIEARSTHSIRQTIVTISPAPLPDKFVAMAAYRPEDLIIIGNDIHCASLPCDITYYVEYDRPDRPGSVMDTPAVFHPLLAQMVTARALNRNEYNTSLEQQYIQLYTTEILKIARLRDGLVTSAKRKPKYEL